MTAYDRREGLLTAEVPTFVSQARCFTRQVTGCGAAVGTMGSEAVQFVPGTDALLGTY